jgi:hypothetical protein
MYTQKMPKQICSFNSTKLFERFSVTPSLVRQSLQYSSMPTLQYSSMPTLQYRSMPTLQCIGMPTLQCSGMPTLQCSSLPTLQCSIMPTLLCTALDTHNSLKHMLTQQCKTFNDVFYRQFCKSVTLARITISSLKLVQIDRNM